MKISKQKIEILMVKGGLNASQLSERMGVSRQAFSTIKNRGSCNPQTAAKLCAGLGCTIDEITEEV